MTFWEYLDNRNARRAELARLPSIRTLANVMGCFLVFGFVGALFSLFHFAIPKENETIVTYAVGQLSGLVGIIVAYHYGSKAGEAEAAAKRADANAKVTDVVVEAAKAATGTGNGGSLPKKVEVVNAKDNPVPVDPKAKP